MIIKIIRYILGYINFKASGGLADRFLNLCTQRGIPLWNISNNNGNIYASTTIKGYFSLKEPARKSGMKLRAIEKKGIVFLLKKHKKRMGILGGICVAFLLMAVLSQFVWNISVVGNNKLETEFLLKEYEKLGMKIGTPIRKIDPKEIADNALQSIDGLSWTSVNRKGTSVVIEVRETKEVPKIYDGNTPTNVIAKEDGLILQVDTLCGTPTVKPGWAVTKGDLLISGIIKNTGGKETITHSDGYVKALVKRNQKFYDDNISIFPLEFYGKKYSLYFFGLNFSMGKKVPNDFYTKHKSFLNSKDTVFPVGIISEWGGKYGENKVEIGNELKNKLGLLSCSLYEKNLMDKSEIIDSKITLQRENSINYYAIYTESEEEIGEIREIYIEKTNDIS